VLFGEHPRMTSVIQMSRSATRAEHSPSVGEHTMAVLAEHGYGEAEIAVLLEDSVIAVG
jgi:crotonobetainyl-CoA:carnitine CoA-transferase CaiB-like acyl-CoA transferase